MSENDGRSLLYAVILRFIGDCGTAFIIRCTRGSSNVTERIISLFCAECVCVKSFVGVSQSVSLINILHSFVVLRNTFIHS